MNNNKLPNKNTLNTPIALDTEQKESLLNNLDNIKSNSDPMSPSEYMKEYISTFEQAFPEYKSKNSDPNELKLFSDCDKLDFNRNSYDTPITKDILKYITSDEGKKLSELKHLNEFLFKDNFTQDLMSSIKTTTNVENSNAKLNDYITIKDKYLIINMDNSSKLLKEFIEKYGENLVDAVSISPFVGAYFMYKHQVKTFELSTQVDSSKFIPTEYNAFQLQRLRTIRFYRVQAFLTALGFASISSSVLKFSLTKLLKPGSSLLSSSSGPEMVNSEGNSCLSILLAILNKFNHKLKNSKLFKFTFFLISLPIFFFSIKLILPYINDTSTIFFIKYILILFLSFSIMYYLFKLHILIKYHEMDYNKIEVPEYLPKFIQNILFELKDISKFNSYNLFLNLYLKSVVYMFITLLILTVFSYFIPTLS